MLSSAPDNSEESVDKPHHNGSVKLCWGIALSLLSSEQLKEPIAQAFGELSSLNLGVKSSYFTSFQFTGPFWEPRSAAQNCQV